MQNPLNRLANPSSLLKQNCLIPLCGVDHPFRRLNEILDFETLIAPMRAAYSTLGAHGIDVERGVKALLIQFWEKLL